MSDYVRRRPTILIVDDDPEIRELYRTVLRLEGFDVVTASDGVEALQAVEGWTPSLVVLDLNMPCLDGGSVLRELSSHPETRHTPVVVVTGSDAVRLADSGATVLRKPVTPEQLLPVIERRLKAA